MLCFEGPIGNLDLANENIDIHWVPNIFSLNLINHSVKEMAGLPLLTLSESPLIGWPDLDAYWARSRASMASLKTRAVDFRVTMLSDELAWATSKCALPVCVQVLHLSSNAHLKEVDSLVSCTQLTQLFLNGCPQLERLPEGLVVSQKLVVSHCPLLQHLPVNVWHAWRAKDMVENGVEIVWQPNPQLKEGATTADVNDDEDHNETEKEEEESVLEYVPEVIYKEPPRPRTNNPQLLEDWKKLVRETRQEFVDQNIVLAAEKHNVDLQGQTTFQFKRDEKALFGNKDLAETTLQPYLSILGCM